MALFIEPNFSAISQAKILGADCVELHTGNYCNLFNNNRKARLAFIKLKKTALFAQKIGLKVHAGHGITYKTAQQISKIKYISELNIGHFIIAESVFVSLKHSIKKFKKIINK